MYTEPGSRRGLRSLSVASVGVCLALLWLGGCGSPVPPAEARRCLRLPPDQGAAVARVGNTPITVKKVVAEIRDQGPSAVRRYSHAADLRQFVEDQIRFQLLVEAAFERGLDHDPEVVEAAHKVMVRRLLERDLGPSAFAGAVSDAAVAAYYQRHQDDYEQPEKRRILEIQLAPTQAGRALALGLIAKLQAHPHDRGIFRSLAVRYSMNKRDARQTGEPPFHSYDTFSQEYGKNFASAVFSASPTGLIPHPVQSIRGWHVVDVLARRDALHRSLDDVRDDIRDKLTRGQRSKAFEQYLMKIRQRHPVALYENYLPKIQHMLAAGDEDASQ